MLRAFQTASAARTDAKTMRNNPATLLLQIKPLLKALKNLSFPFLPCFS